MKATALLIPVLLLLSLATAQLLAADGGVEQVGNYCRECHTPGDARLAAPLIYVGGGEQGTATPCKVVNRLRREVYYTGQLVAAPDSTDGGPAQLAFIRATGGEVTSAEATLEQVRTTRRILSQSQARLQQIRARRWRRLALAVTIAAALVLLVGANPHWPGRRLEAAPTGGTAKKPKLSFAVVLASSSMLIFVALSPAIFRGAVGAVESTEEQAAIEQAASVAERSAAQVWMMGQIGAEWAALDKARGEEALDRALQAAQSRRFISRAWALQAAGRAWTPVDPRRAADILALARKVAEENERAALYRDLDLRLVAVAQAELDVRQGLQTVRQVRDPAIRCWGLREIAALTGGAGAADIYSDALAAAQEIDDPSRRARALLEIGRLWATTNEKAADAVFVEARETAEEIEEGPGKAYLLSDLAAAWAISNPQEGQEVARLVNGAWAEARATAIHRVAVAWPGEDPAHADDLFRLAWDVSGEIEDAYSRARVRLTVVNAWGNLAPGDLPNRISEMEPPLLRAEAERNLALSWPDKDSALETARNIDQPYFQVEALTGIGSALAETAPTQAEALFREAAALGSSLPADDTRPLRDLAIAWARLDPTAALRLVDGIEPESDRADALRAIAVAQARQDPASADETFDRALRQTMTVRVPGDELAAANATLELARAFASLDRAKAEAAFKQALELVEQLDDYRERS